MVGRTVSHYRVLKLLGSGGMGTVYQAEDTRLGRQVALKFLSADLTRDRRALDRFQREARAASALNHPHICTIYDIDEAVPSTGSGQAGSGQAVPFIAMELLEGQTLKERLHPAGGPEGPPLRVAEIVDLGLQLADALETAHAKGIIHRDLKPANVFLTTRGTAKLLDFGLAKLAAEPREGASEAPTAAGGWMTGAGVAVGTVGYMSPEQVRGEALDARTDLFSLGVVLYEMATGTAAFRGATSGAVLGEILTKAPTAPVRLNPDLPEALERIINKALEKDREVRYQSAREMMVDLTRLKRERESGRTPAPGVVEAVRTPSLAVLPFANLSADKENEYFSDGLAEDIIDALTQVPGLRVMARTSAFAFRGKEQDVRKIGAELNVGNILEGSVRRAGNRIRVTAQLVKASDGYHLWSQRFDREMTDVFAIQDEISQAIVEKLRVRLSADRPLVKRYTENLAAYDLCLRARHQLSKWTQEGREAGRGYCEQAIALDPNYALARVVLSESHWWSAYWGFTNPREALPRARLAALEALRLDDTIAEAHSMSGAVLACGEFDWPGAEREFRQALELNPSSADVRSFHALFFLRALGRVDEALVEMRRAVELDPFDVVYNSELGYLLHVTRRFESAIAQFRHVIDLDPTYFVPYWFLSITCALTGRLDQAIAAAEKANELSGHNALTMGMLGRLYGLAGRPAEARQLLEELTARRRVTYVPASALAFVHRGLGESDKGLEWYARAIEERDPSVIVSLKTEPSYDAIRSQPVYQTLLRKMNLEP